MRVSNGVHTWGTKSSTSVVSSINDSFWGTTIYGKPMKTPFFRTVSSDREIVEPSHGPVAEHRGDDVVGQAWILRRAGNSWEI